MSIQQNFLDTTIQLSLDMIAETPMPTMLYVSTVRSFGGRIVKCGKYLVYDTTGIKSTVDRILDPLVRTYADDHVSKNPGRMLATHPKWFFKFLFPGAMRYRGTAGEIVANAERLCLPYGPYPRESKSNHLRGVEILHPETYYHGIFQNDLYNPSVIRNSDLIKSIDPMAALAVASRYIRQLHEHGGIGEVNATKIIFQKIENGMVYEPCFVIPDIIFNPKKDIPESAKIATDLLEYIVFMGIAAQRRTGDWSQVGQTIQTIVENYNDPKAISTVLAFAKRGRLTLEGDEEALHLPLTVTTKYRRLLASHNNVRLGISENKKVLKISDVDMCHYVAQLRKGVIEICERYLRTKVT